MNGLPMSPGEEEIARAGDIYIKKFRFTASLTTKRIILADASTVPQPPRSIQLSTITMVSPCRDKVSGEPCISLSIQSEDAQQKQMRLIFTELGSQKRAAERDEWIQHLHRLIGPASPKPAGWPTPAPPSSPPSSDPLAPGGAAAGMTGSACPGCGAAIPGDSVFCPFCGTPAGGRAPAPERRSSPAPAGRPLDVSDLSYVYGKSGDDEEAPEREIDRRSLVMGVCLGFLAFFLLAWVFGSVAGVGMFVDIVTPDPVEVVKQGQDLILTYHPGNEVVTSMTVYVVKEEGGVVSKTIQPVEANEAYTMEGLLSNTTDFVAVTGAVEEDGTRLLLKRWL